ncbi:Rne/Rng family ribonuclease [Alkaliphilus hydrothermalis]|uniref:Ribonuclease G n=1 Tax=Alkaliphilus hydrothermalis TaxID=1482730 RepID=A0ABS2NKW9_9FIRM|nr:Rne/Rng family ribonuclease [Alkaliphilus hydrothermalis]MBM7613590.1 ribonuclease G [Alkaliphilus hydrothermalis]
MNQIVVDVGLVETRLALLENQELVELYVERKNQKRIVGNIYKGRVTNVLPGMQAAFVDIGLEKNSFLYVKDAIPEELLNEDGEGAKAPSIKDILKPGQELIVQVIKEPIGTKGARVTTHLTLPGRYMVLMPNTDYVGISRRIGNEEERERLKREIEELKPGKMGIIVRTVAAGKTKEDFKDDIKFLLKLWQKIERDKKLGFAPRVIYKDFDLINRTLRDIFNKDIDQFIINDREEYQSAKDLVDLISPHLSDRLVFEEDDVFETYKIDSQINKGLSRKLWLKSGGYIVIDTTEALTVVDVNTGKYVGSTDLDDTVFKTNLEAATEIAKQLRLRDIGGIIIVDFIDMTNEKYDEEVINVLEKALSKDRTKTKILGMTNLGLVEITRKKVRQRLDFLLQRKCENCEGTGKVASEYTLLHKLEKHLKRMKEHTTCTAVLFEVSPTTLEVIDTQREILEEMERITDIKVFFAFDEKLPYGELNRKNMGNIEMIEKLLQEK